MVDGSQPRDARVVGARAELLSLNAHLRSAGAPASRFGAPEGVAVGTMLERRTELAISGIHRHFLADVCHTVVGVESLILSSSAPGAGTSAVDCPFCDDFGERLLLGSWALAGTEQQDVCQRALDANCKSRQPIRVVRVVRGAASARAGSSASNASAARRFRYDGLYVALRRTSQAAELLGTSTVQRYLLIRSPDQPPLPRPPPTHAAAAASAGQAPGWATDAGPGGFGHMGLRLQPVPALRRLPPDLEAITGSAATVRVDEALCRLVVARQALIESMAPHERLAVAGLREQDRRRKRLAIEMLHAADDPMRDVLPHPELAAWPSCRRPRSSPCASVDVGIGRQRQAVYVQL
jgi:hypothetical protein